MFAVKGWSVDASALKPQTEPFKGAKKDEDGKGSKKRKRGEGQSGPGEDVGKLWDRHIEGKAPVKGSKQKKKERKKQKLDNGQDGKSDHADARASGPDGEPSKADEGETPKKKKDKKPKQARDNEDGAVNVGHETAKDATLSAVPALPATSKLTPMQAAMRQKLISARFRHLNQTLYTAPSDQALELFDQNPEMFEDYHAGFRQQVEVWPENPVDNFIATIRSRGKMRSPKYKDKKGKGDAQPESKDCAAEPLPRTHGTCIVADLGCGDARLAQTLKDSGDNHNLNLKVHSFDLRSPSPLVTKADISKLPIPDGSVDVAIFCLALMGTNWISFIEEAYRILHWKGELWVAEIKSRFGRVGRAGKPVEHSVGGKKKQAALKKVQEAKKKEDEEVDEQTALRTEVDGVETKQEETDVSAFVDVLRRRGFLLKDGEKSIDLENKMFVKMELVKAAAATKGKCVPKTDGKDGEKAGVPKKKKFLDQAAEQDVATDDEAKVLKPCLYKIR
jgi:ribosomal RNA-processing protein 8